MKGPDAMLGRPKVVLLTESENSAEARSVSSALDDYAAISQVRTVSQLDSYLQKQQFDAVFCGWDFYESDWDGRLRDLRSRHPEIPMIVLSGGRTEPDWQQVVESGAFDLLAFPSPKELAMAVTEHAVSSHEARISHRTVAM
jgi:DNA-binding NtrC family response regulator